MVFSQESKQKKFDQSKILYSIYSIRESMESVNKNSIGRRDDSFNIAERDISDNFDLAFNHASDEALKDQDPNKQASVLEID